MFDFITYYNYWIDDIFTQSDTIITLEDYIEDSEILEEVLLEKLKEYLEIESVEIISCENLVNRDVYVEEI